MKQEVNLDEVAMNFIIGPGRSGTTLLVMLLNEIDGCVASPEIKHTMYFYKSYGKVKNINSKLVEAYNHYIQENKTASNNPLYNINEVSFDEIMECGNIDYSGLSSYVHLQLHKSKNKAIHTIFDKNNFYTFFVPELKSIFPKAKFCVMIRDPRAFVVSNLRSQHGFKGNKNVAYYGFAWNSYMKEISKILEKYSRDVFVLKYEDLVSDKERQMIAFCNFFDLDYSPKIFDFYKKIGHIEKDSLNERMKKKLNDLSQPISGALVNSWMEKLDSNQRYLVEQICGKIANNFGYQMVRNENFMTRFLLHLRYFKNYCRVSFFFRLKSIKIHHYLNVSKRASYYGKK